MPFDLAAFLADDGGSTPSPASTASKPAPRAQPTATSGATGRVDYDQIPPGSAPSPPAPVVPAATPVPAKSSESGFDLKSFLADDSEKPVSRKVDGMLSKATGNQSGTFHLDPDGSHQPATEPLPLPKSMPPAKTVVQAEPGSIPEGQGSKVLVTYVDDGDTFNFKTDRAVPDAKAGANGKLTCRIDSIDAPELDHGRDKPGQPGGKEAGDYLRKMIDNKEVTIKIARQDEHGRNICQVELEGKGIDYAMVKSGLAWIVNNAKKFNDPPRRDALQDLQHDNFAKGRGVFGMQGSEEPYKWRQDHWAKDND